MKIKKILALLLSVSMLGILSACDDKDSSDKKEDKDDKEIATEVIEEDEDKEAEEEAEKLKKAEEEAEKLKEAEEEAEKLKKAEEEAEQAAEDANKEYEDLAEDFNAEHPEETVISLIENGFSSSFNENMKVEYDEATTTYTIDVWQKGFAAALELEQGADALNSMVDTLESSLEYMTEQIRLLDDDANVVFNFVSDEDQSVILFTIENGTMTYNIVE